MEIVNHKPLIEVGRATRFGPDWPGKRCLAKTRRGTPCQKAALKGKTRCRLHDTKPSALSATIITNGIPKYIEPLEPIYNKVLFYMVYSRINSKFGRAPTGLIDPQITKLAKSLEHLGHLSTGRAPRITLLDPRAIEMVAPDTGPCAVAHGLLGPNIPTTDEMDAHGLAMGDNSAPRTSG